MKTEMTKEHDWMYGGVSPETVCIKCGLRRDAPGLATNGQAFAPCKGTPQTTCGTITVKIKHYALVCAFDFLMGSVFGFVLRICFEAH